MKIIGYIHKHLCGLLDRLNTKAAILVYHRVADLTFDPQLLAVSQQHFYDQIAYLKQHYTVISLADLHECLEKRKIPHKSIVITFDDGYIDNINNAYPILKTHQSPATIFVTTGHIDQSSELWWDELENIIFNSNYEKNLTISLNVGGKHYSWNLEPLNIKSDLQKWNVCSKITPANVCQFYNDAHTLIKPLSKKDRDDALSQLAQQLNCQALPRAHTIVMNRELLKKIGSDPLIDIGAHTRNHLSLAFHPFGIQEEEIRGSKKDLERILGKSIRHFSYPYGGMPDIGDKAPNIVAESGFSLAVANFSGCINKNTHPFLLPRFLVRNWNKETFSQHLERWFRA